MRRSHRKERSPGSVEDEMESEGDLSDSGGTQTSSHQDLRSSIRSSLKKIKTPIAFAFSAVSSSLPNPGLQLLDHRVIGLPLSPDDAQKIISLASPSPFGKKEETLVDESVRRCWELQPSQFSLKNPEWGEAMSIMLDSVKTGLGILKGTGKISAELNKLLLYEPGAFFKAHTDSEKGPGMFATLVVCLPSPHEGGKLVLTHDNEKYEFETALSSNFSTSYAAWYADICHEVLPVTSGYRLMLTYNLIWTADSIEPSHNIARGHVQQLSTLLQQYNSQLESEENELPPILLHKLYHKYTKANLQFNLLKPRDLVQVQILSELSAKVGFIIYLATLELTVEKDEECTDYEEKSQQLENIVDLDGKLVVEDFDYPEGAFLDPKPQDGRKADEVHRQGWTGNEGCPVTYWYRDTVVVLVPPAKQLEFTFHFSSKGKVIEPLFSKLIKTFSEDAAQKPKLEKLCELALKQKLTWLDCPYYSTSQSHSDFEKFLENTPLFFKQAATTALNFGYFELFDIASKRTNDKIMLMPDIPQKLGRWVASKGFTTMKDRLMKGINVAPSISEKVKFLESVMIGFEANLQDSSSTESFDLKQWSDTALFSAISQLSTLSKADGVSLGKLHRTTDWCLFRSSSMPIIERTETVVKIAFTNEFMSTFQHDLNQEQRSFIEPIICSIWRNFAFDSSQSKSVSNNAHIKDMVKENDLLHILENTITVLPPEYLETAVIPALLNAIPSSSKECAREVFIEVVRMIIKNELAGFKLPTAASVPPALHKVFVQALLVKFLIENVGLEPKAPKDWSLPAGSCNCSDCTKVNNFLRNPVQQSLDFPCGKQRRLHLHQQFTNVSKATYDVVTVRQRNPNVWRITKHRRGYETSKSNWLKNTETAVETFAKLKNDESVNGKLEMYLQPYYSIIMKASVKELPDLKHLVSTQETSKNVCLAHNSEISQADFKGLKRGMDEIDPQNHGTAKRTREFDGTEV
nr:PREDICTED: uncharacterized protein LOC109037454 [Bemisia tabaci]